MNRPQRVFVQEIDHIRIAVMESDSRARRNGWQLIASILVMGVCFIIVALARLP